MFIKKRKTNRKEIISGDLNGLFSGFLARKRMEAVLPFVKKSNRICDIGCGVFRWDGILPAEADYTGIDIEEDIVRHNKNISKHNFLVKDVEQDDLKDIGEGFDLILMLAVIEHFKRPDTALQKLKDILAPDGSIVLTTPHPCGDIILNIGAKICLFSSDKHTHNDLLNKHMIIETAVSAGLKVKEYKRFLFGLNQFAILG